MLCPGWSKTNTTQLRVLKTSSTQQFYNPNEENKTTAILIFTKNLIAAHLFIRGGVKNSYYIFEMFL